MTRPLTSLVLGTAAAIVAGAIMLAPVVGHAGSIKRVHALRAVSAPQGMPDPRIKKVYPDMSGGNAAAGGNNANSMSGSNSAAENANGRTSGGAGFGG